MRPATAPVEDTAIGFLHGLGVEEMEPGSLGAVLVTEANGSVLERRPG